MERVLALIYSVASASLAADGLYATSRSVYSRSSWHISPAVAEKSSPTVETSRMGDNFNARGMTGLFRYTNQFIHDRVSGVTFHSCGLYGTLAI